MSVLPPSSFLPTIRAISSTPPARLHECIASLREIYNPPVRGTRRRCAGTRRPSIGGMTDLRADRFELNYVLTWLTALLSRQSELGCEEEGEEHERGASGGALVTEASKLLALCAGTASAGTIDRLLEFSGPGAGCSSAHGKGTNSGGVSVVLRDVPLDNDDYGSVGAQTWGGACVLSEMVVEDPGRFGLGAATPQSPLLVASSSTSSTATLVNAEGEPESDKKIPDEHPLGLTTPPPSRPLRVLELGAGTGLVSLVVSKVLQNQSTEAEVIASDYYPAVLQNLAANISSNHPTTRTVTCSSHPLDWSQFPSAYKANRVDAVFSEPFDLVFGADVIYEPLHAQWIKSCLEILLAKPSTAAGAFFHLLFPLRPTHKTESESIEAVFLFAKDGDDEVEGLRIYEKETIVCDTDTGEEVVYVYYRIGW